MTVASSKSAQTHKGPNDVLQEELEGDGRDLVDLWNEALLDYQRSVGINLQAKYGNVKGIADFASKEMEKFKKFRHSKSKVDKLRSLLRDNLECIKRGTQQLATAATTAFPPAAAIGAALTCMITACHDVSSDFDVVVDFFEDMNSFLGRIVIIEKRVPNSKPYHICLMDVFTAFLSMSGIATKYIVLGRLKKWASRLVKGDDSDLQDAHRRMDKALDRLENATRLAILSNSENLQKMNEELRQNQEHHSRVLEEQTAQLNAIRAEFHEMAKLVAAWQRKGDNGKTGQDRGKGPEGQVATARPLAQVILSYFKNVEARITEYHILKETMVPGTCSWFFAEKAWVDWLSSQQDETRSQVLSVIGGPGTGKGHLAAAIYDHLHSRFRGGPDGNDDNCVAHFYFRGGRESLPDLNDAVASVVYQVCEQSTSACGIIYRNLCCRKFGHDEVDVTEWKSLLDELLAPVFDSGSKRRLFIIFDHFDDLLGDDINSFIEFLDNVEDRGLRIHVCFTSQPFVTRVDGEEIEPSYLKVVMDKQKQLPDIKALAWDRVNGLDGLKKFSRYVKQRITEKVEEVAPNMLYAEHMLHRYSELAREGAVLQDMKKPAPGDINALYESMVDECYRRTATEHRGAVAALLQWISFSISPLTLDDIRSLLRFITKDSSFDIEDIPQPFSKFLRVGHPKAVVEEEEDKDPASAEARIGVEGRIWTPLDLLELDTLGSDYLEEQFNDGALPVNFQVRQMKSFFCRWDTRSEDHDRQQTAGCLELRKTRAQAYRDMFLVCAQLVHPDEKGTFEKLAPGLQKCVVCDVLFYWLNIEPENDTPAENKAVMEAFAALIRSRNGYAEMVLRQDGSFRYHSLLRRLRKWKSIAAADDHLLAQLAPDERDWWDAVFENPQIALGYLAKGQVRAMYRSSDLVSAKKAYVAAREALHIAGLDEKVIKQAYKNYGVQINTGRKWLLRKYVLLGIPGLFSSFEMDSAAHCVTAELLSSMPEEKLRASELLARIQLEMGDDIAAHRTIAECLGEQQAESGGVAPSLRRRAHVTLARIERSMGNTAAAAASYVAAKASDPEGLTPGDILAEEVGLFDSEDRYSDLIAAIRRWKLSDQVVYLTWTFKDGSSRPLLREAASHTGEAAFLIDMYEKVIRCLDNVDAGAPMRCELADVQKDVCKDLWSARRLLDEVLDSRRSSRDPYMFTNADPATTASDAVLQQNHTLQLLFHQAVDPESKARLFQSVKGLTKRPLVLDQPDGKLDILLQCHYLVMARMARKMGPAAEFQYWLKKVIDAGFKGLSDDASWNDFCYIVMLARALAFLSNTVSGTVVGPRLLWAARVLGSAMFSQLDPAVTFMGGQTSDVGSEEEEEEEEEEGEEKEKEEEEDDDDDDDDDSDDDDDDDDETSNGNNSNDSTPPADEGDLSELFQGVPGIVSCQGSDCNPRERYCWWGGRTVYMCITANHGKEAQDMSSCGQNHKYLQLPVEGWKGITKGRMEVQDAKGDVREMTFGEYLNEVRGMCAEAWEAFWRGP
ncbi:hypothetical protein CEP54_001048 [Fusarium duplospermum]|uniref:Uncharacterized protein n=1 Tax=Fusarium duplospermum TaxID=1325734 RepID=A0A428R332_9HYPO|nr:hypothetical protein CEP54_001048 [Fusarium duplospermum]